MDIRKFGYPEQCDKCKNLPCIKLKLPAPYHNKVTSSRKVMLIGQDPYIYRDPDRVECVLMLDQEKGQLSTWLRDVLGEHSFREVELYATNVVKCPVQRDSSTSPKRTLGLLQSCFDNCKGYLINEITSFKPTIILTFGQAAHKLFVSTLDNNHSFKDSMKEAFTGEFIKASLERVGFQYSPCLHIKTYRVAETYGEQVKQFRRNLRSIL
jgi:uracil-DNA glycosylase